MQWKLPPRRIKEQDSAKLRKWTRSMRDPNKRVWRECTFAAQTPVRYSDSRCRYNHTCAVSIPVTCHKPTITQNTRHPVYTNVVRKDCPVQIVFSKPSYINLGEFTTLWSPLKTSGVEMLVAAKTRKWVYRKTKLFSCEKTANESFDWESL